jgi:two-component sensor histidine kinase
MNKNRDKVLVIDDEDVVVAAVTKHLKRDYTVVSADDGKGGLELFIKERPILIILDLRMPEMDGVEFLENLRPGPQDPYSVIVLTGHGSDEDMERCFDLGVSAFLHKPFNVFELRGIVKNCVALKKMENELRQNRAHLEDKVEERTKELTDEVAVRRQAEERLKASLREKEVLMREIHHRVKNNLQIVSSLLDLQSRYIKDPETLSIFKNSQMRLRSMALIHEKLYQADDLANIDFTKYVSTLVEYLRRSYEGVGSGVSIEMDIEGADRKMDGIRLSIDAAVPCGLIINEIVTNSMKHAFPSGPSGPAGTIRISLKTRPGGLHVLEIGDDGVGLPGHYDISKASSLGVRLIKALATEQLDGKIDIDTTNGLKYRIEFKDIKYFKRG